jgi:hypothetical protein
VERSVEVQVSEVKIQSHLESKLCPVENLEEELWMIFDVAIQRSLQEMRW